MESPTAIPEAVTDLRDLIVQPPRLRTNFDSVLFTRAHPIDDAALSDPILGALCGMLRRHLVQDTNAVGLAAPQLGYPLRVIAVRPNARAGVTVIVNPRVIATTADVATEWEQCLSCPGARVQVERARHIQVEATESTREGYTVTRVVTEYSGFLARVIQHEVDHLDGVTLLVRAGAEGVKAAQRTIAWAAEQTEGARVFLERMEQRA